MPVAENISIESAKKDKLFYFVANVVVYRESDGRCLVLKRSAREIVHPGKYATPGGKLEWQNLDANHPDRMNGEVKDYLNAVEKLLQRETKEEAGIEIDTANIKYINSVAFIRPDGIPVVLVKFAAKYKSGDVVLQPGDFDDYKWVNTDEVKILPCILGVEEEIEKTIQIFNSK